MIANVITILFNRAKTDNVDNCQLLLTSCLLNCFEYKIIQTNPEQKHWPFFMQQAVVTIFFKSTIYFFEKNNWVLFFRCAFGHVSWTKHKNLFVHSAAIVETLSVWLTAPIQSKPSYTSSSPFLLSFPLYFQESRNIKQRENKETSNQKARLAS